MAMTNVHVIIPQQLSIDEACRMLVTTAQALRQSDHTTGAIINCINSMIPVPCAVSAIFPDGSSHISASARFNGCTLTAAPSSTEVSLRAQYEAHMENDRETVAHERLKVDEAIRNYAHQAHCDRLVRMARRLDFTDPDELVVFCFEIITWYRPGVDRLDVNEIRELLSRAGFVVNYDVQSMTVRSAGRLHYAANCVVMLLALFDKHSGAYDKLDYGIRGYTQLYDLALPNYNIPSTS